MAELTSAGAPTPSADAVVLDAAVLEVTELNERLRALAAEGTDARIVNPAARHHLVVGVLDRITIEIEGTAGYFAASLLDGPDVHITGSAGWSLGDNLMQGRIVVEKNAGAFVGPGMRGGTIVVRGSAGNRLGQVMKGGTIIVGGDAGFMTGNMLINGTVIILGNVGQDCGEHIVAGTIYVGGSIASLGEDAVEAEFTDDDRALVTERLAPYGFTVPETMRKVISAGRLHHYKTREF